MRVGDSPRRSSATGSGGLPRPSSARRTGSQLSSGRSRCVRRSSAWPLALGLPLEADDAPVAPATEAAPLDPFGLTPREREVLALVSIGRTNRQIADELFISESTAGVHVSNILGKLGVASRTEAAGIAVRLDLGSVHAADATDPVIAAAQAQPGRRSSS